MITIHVRDLVVEASHGWHPHEKNENQRFKINVELMINLNGNETDDLADTVNWSEIRDQVVSVTKNNSFNLVEKLAQAIADKLLTNASVSAVVVSIDKLDAFPNGVPGVRLELSR